jgi:hypothetical protein
LPAFMLVVRYRSFGPANSFVNWYKLCSF